MDAKLPEIYFLSLFFFIKVPVQFEFINKLDDQTYCKPWLAVRPHKACINIGK